MHAQLWSHPDQTQAVTKAALRCVVAHREQGLRATWTAPPDFAVFGPIEIGFQLPALLRPASSAEHKLRIWSNRRSVLRASWTSDPSVLSRPSQMRPGKWIDIVLGIA